MLWPGCRAGSSCSTGRLGAAATRTLSDSLGVSTSRSAASRCPRLARARGSLSQAASHGEPQAEAARSLPDSLAAPAQLPAVCLQLVVRSASGSAAGAAPRPLAAWTPSHESPRPAAGPGGEPEPKPGLRAWPGPGGGQTPPGGEGLRECVCAETGTSPETDPISAACQCEDRHRDRDIH